MPERIAPSDGSPTQPDPAARFFECVVRHGRAVLWASGIVVAVAVAGLFQLEKDTRNRAYMAQDHPAYRSLDQLEETFGLSDGVVVAVVREGAGDVFNPDTLALVAWLTDETRRLEGVDPERVTSLSTAKSILARGDGIEIEPFWRGRVADQAEADRVRAAVAETGLYVDKLVSRDGRATVVSAELLDPDDGANVYHALVALAERAPRSEGDVIHVAGLGAYNALIGDYVDADASRLNPITALLILAMLFIAHRTWRGVWAPFAIATGSVVVAMGGMGLAGVPVYGITNSLSVILIAIAVSDSIHIMGEYYANVASHPHRSPREHAVRTLCAMWRPVLITSVTSMAGFLALSAASGMPPMRAYGVFASLGVLAALIFSTTTLPALLARLPVRPSPAFAGMRGEGSDDAIARAARALGRAILPRARAWTALGGVIVIVGGIGLPRVEVEEDSLKYLADGEPLRTAEATLNEHLGGVSSLDISFETQEPDGMLEPGRLAHVAALQAHLETHPRVAGTFSLADYLAQMHRAMSGGPPRLPGDADLAAQYLLLFGASADPTALDEVVDFEASRANLRVALRDARWSTARAVHDEARSFLARHPDPPGLTTRLSGWGNVTEYLRRDVARGSALGAGLAALAVLTAAIVCFRSVAAGMIAFLPVAAALLLQFAVMGLGGIWLSLITSMGSALAIGLSIDFGIHAVDRLLTSTHQQGRTLDDALSGFYARTGRALLLNFSALAVGFAVLTTSLLPAMREFGLVLVTCIATGFVASMVFLPALVAWLQPRFLTPRAHRRDIPAALGRAA